jgi:phosphate ABC transporter, permease protein PstA
MIKKPAPVNAFAAGHLPRRSELYTLAGALVISAAFLALFGFSVVGWLVLSAAVYLVAIGVLSTAVENKRKAADRVVRGLVTIAFLLAVIPLVSTLLTVFFSGSAAVTWQFLTHTTGSVFDPKTLKVTTIIGSVQATVGTLIITAISALISVPIGIMAAIYLVEYGDSRHWMSRTVTFLVDVMTGIPSIVAGLFAFSLFTLIVGPKAFSGLSASIALAVLMIPIVVRSTEEMLKLVPADLREASFALGVTKMTTILRIVLPTALSGIVTGVMLSVSRVIGETAPIFMAASFTDNFNSNPFSGAMQTLPVMAYTGYAFPNSNIQESYQSAWGAALLLVLFVVVLNLVARLVARIFTPKRAR